MTTAQLCETHLPDALDLARRYGSRRPDLRDVYESEAGAALWRAARRWDGRRPFAHLLTTCCHNAFTSAARSAARHRTADVYPDAVPDHRAARAAARLRAREEAEDAIARSPAHARPTLRLMAETGESVDFVARRLGIAHRSASRHLTDARRALAG